MPETTAPVGVDEDGNPIQTVTVTASRLADPIWIVAMITAIIAWLAWDD